MIEVTAELRSRLERGFCKWMAGGAGNASCKIKAQGLQAGLCWIRPLKYVLGVRFVQVGM